MLILNINIDGKTTEDLENALEEILKLVRGSYKCGRNSNEDGHFAFNISGEEEGILGQHTHSFQQDSTLSFQDLKTLYYVEGMETWTGDAVADAFNDYSDTMQIEYVGNSIWKVTANLS